MYIFTLCQSGCWIIEYNAVGLQNIAFMINKDRWYCKCFLPFVETERMRSVYYCLQRYERELLPIVLKDIKVLSLLDDVGDANYISTIHGELASLKLGVMVQHHAILRSLIQMYVACKRLWDYLLQHKKILRFMISICIVVIVVLNSVLVSRRS